MPVWEFVHQQDSQLMLDSLFRSLSMPTTLSANLFEAQLNVHLIFLIFGHSAEAPLLLFNKHP